MASDRAAGIEAEYITTPRAAVLLGLAAGTMENWRVQGRGPAYRSLGRRIVYRRDELIAWAEAQRRTSTSDAPPAA
jgi:hypothetical protein